MTLHTANFVHLSIINFVQVGVIFFVVETHTVPIGHLYCFPILPELIVIRRLLQIGDWMKIDSSIAVTISVNIREAKWTPMIRKVKGFNTSRLLEPSLPLNLPLSF